VVVPFVDEDGVEDGNAGKNRAPHDHNRDHGSHSLYPDAMALQDKVTESQEGTVPVIPSSSTCRQVKLKTARAGGLIPERLSCSLVARASPQQKRQP
jgi:hypothetical protein